MRKKTFAPLAFGAAFAVCAVGAAGHVLLDLASGVGVQLLWPFACIGPRGISSAISIFLDSDFAGCRTLLLPLLFGLVNEEVGAREKGPGGSRAAIVTLLLLAAYLGARANSAQPGDRSAALARISRPGSSIGGSVSRSSAPFRWRGVAVTDDTIEDLEFCSARAMNSIPNAA